VAVLVGTGFELFVAHYARPSNGTVAVHVVAVGFRKERPGFDTPLEIGMTKATRRVAGTIQVAGSLVVVVVVDRVVVDRAAVEFGDHEWSGRC